MLRKRAWAGLVPGLLVGLVLSSVLARGVDDRSEELRREFFEPLGWLLAQIEEHAVEEVDRHDLLVGAYQGMLSALDRYSVYWPPEMLQEFEADLEGEFGGLGIQITFDPHGLLRRVEQPIAGTPAAKQGVVEGDLIIKVLEESTQVETKTEDFKSVHDAVKLLRGKPGAKVTITIVHETGGEERDITITRAKIRVPGVRAVEMIDLEQKIGYIHVHYFSKPTPRDMVAAIRDLDGQGLKGLILDLRLNPGGLLEAAEQCVDFFLDADADIVTIKDRSGAEETHRTKHRALFGDVPLVLLINRYSASGAEILAAGLRDHDRAVLVGEPTFGKASVQSLYTNPHDRSGIKLTIAHYYTPAGRLIERKGVEPDVEVKLSDEETRKLARHLSRKTAYPPLPPDEPEPAEGEGTEGEEAEPEEEFRDVSLERAVEVMADLLAGRAPITDSAVRERVAASAAEG